MSVMECRFPECGSQLCLAIVPSLLSTVCCLIRLGWLAGEVPLENPANSENKVSNQLSVGVLCVPNVAIDLRKNIHDC